MKNNTPLIVTVLFIIVVAAVAPISEIAALENQSIEGDLTKAFPASSPLVIPAAAFSTKGNNAESHTMVWNEGLIEGTSSPGGCVQAPAYLPQFARVYQFWISYIDEDGGTNFSAWFSRTSNFTKNEMDDMGTVTTTGTDPNVRSVGDDSVEHPIVIHPDYSYFVSTCLPTENTKLLSARIWYYTDVIFADGFERGSGANWAEVQP